MKLITTTVNVQPVIVVSATQPTTCFVLMAYPGILFGGGGVQQIHLRTEGRENGDLGAVAPLVRGSGGSCNLVQEISFHIVKCS